MIGRGLYDHETLISIKLVNLTCTGAAFGRDGPFHSDSRLV